MIPHGGYPDPERTLPEENFGLAPSAPRETTPAKNARHAIEGVLLEDTEGVPMSDPEGACLMAAADYFLHLHEQRRLEAEVKRLDEEVGSALTPQEYANARLRRDDAKAQAEKHRIAANHADSVYSDARKARQHLLDQQG